MLLAAALDPPCLGGDAGGSGTLDVSHALGSTSCAAETEQLQKVAQNTAKQGSAGRMQIRRMHISSARAPSKWHWLEEQLLECLQEEPWPQQPLPGIPAANPEGACRLPSWAPLA